VRIDIVTAFPGFETNPLNYSIVKRAVDRNLVNIRLHDLRKYATDKYRSIDDRPYGGGPGMILRVDVIDAAIRDILLTEKNTKVILTDASGQEFSQGMARSYSKLDQLVIICGHYEGVDHRVHTYLVDEVVSIGKYVLSGGELAALVIADATVRLVPGAVGNELSLKEESYENGREKEYPQFTRPEEYRGWQVPEILLSGDHKKIAQWQKNAHDEDE
jgi:tRNA (guanine37-N1)-methyltransferase